MEFYQIFRNRKRNNRDKGQSNKQRTRNQTTISGFRGFIELIDNFIDDRRICPGIRAIALLTALNLYNPNVKDLYIKPNAETKMETNIYI